MAHKHELVFIREPTEEYKIYWCRECGLIMERFGSRFAEMLPAWSRDRLLSEDRSKETFMYVTEKVEKQERRLGKSLKDLMSSATESHKMKEILENGNK
jgi:ABC-type thiamine transport system substrate-binding protein